MTMMQSKAASRMACALCCPSFGRFDQHIGEESGSEPLRLLPRGLIERCILLRERVQQIIRDNLPDQISLADQLAETVALPPPAKTMNARVLALFRCSIPPGTPQPIRQVGTHNAGK